MGIAFVHQELNLFNDLKVYENIFLQKEYTTKLGRLDKKKMIQEAERLFHELGVDIDPAPVSYTHLHSLYCTEERKIYSDIQ